MLVLFETAAGYAIFKVHVLFCCFFLIKAIFYGLATWASLT